MYKVINLFVRLQKLNGVNIVLLYILSVCIVRPQSLSSLSSLPVIFLVTTKFVTLNLLSGIHTRFSSKSSARQVHLMTYLPGQILGCLGKNVVDKITCNLSIHVFILHSHQKLRILNMEYYVLCTVGTRFTVVHICHSKTYMNVACKVTIQQPKVSTLLSSVFL